MVVEGGDPLLRKAKVRFGGITKEVSVAYTPDVKPGEYVLVHVGFALSVIDGEEAKRVFSYLDEIGEIDEAAAGDSSEV